MKNPDRKIGDRVQFAGDAGKYIYTVSGIVRRGILRWQMIELEELPGQFAPHLLVAADMPAPEEDETPAAPGIRAGDFVAFVQFQSIRYEVEEVYQYGAGPQIVLKGIPGMFSADLFVRADPPEATSVNYWSVLCLSCSKICLVKNECYPDARIKACPFCASMAITASEIFMGSYFWNRPAEPVEDRSAPLPRLQIVK